MPSPKIFHFSPGRILLASFIFVIGIGTLLLSLPQARLVDISLIDLFFTSASATCVTGLVAIPISYFTFFGKCIILCLIQIGGLGLITLSFFFISLFLDLGMATKLIAGQILDFEFWGKVKTYLILIIGITCFIELIGAILLYFPFRQYFGVEKSIFYAIFHSISAFCNAGICLQSNNMINFAQSTFPLLTLSFLVFSGGIGFIVWYELIKWLKHIVDLIKGKRKIFNFTLHTKIVLYTSIILIIAGTIIFWGIEQNNVLKGLDPIKSFVNSFFMSTTMRSTGFFSFKIEQASLATLLVFMLLMFIGASPNSAGSGIKTTTFALFLATIASIAKGKTSIEIAGRTIPIDQIYKATAIIALAIGWIMITTFILLLTEPKFSFIQVIFESVSAFSNVGLSTGITPYISKIGKMLLIISMIVGRIGSLTLLLALRKTKAKHLYSYPKERIILG